MKLPGFVIAALLLTAPTAALAARGIVTDTVSMRAGPGTGFPVVDRVPGGAHVNIHGCLRGDSWCDISWEGDRGWVSSDYLQYYYRNRYVYLPDYVDVIDVPVVPFVLGTYWASHYASRPFYHRRAHWTNYWRSHARFAERPRIGRSAARARGGEERFVRERGERRAFQERTQQRAFQERTQQGRMGRVNRGEIRRGESAGTRQPFVRSHERTRFSGAPNNAGVERSHPGRMGAAPFQGHARGGQPSAMTRPMPHAAPGGGVGTVGRAGGAPMQSRGQMGGAPHGGAPHAMGGGAPHMAAPPSGGGAAMGARGGGGHGRPH
jgi:uncharacterized protein YraI